MNAPWTLCVDFGTAFSKAAAAPGLAWSRFDPGMVRPLMLNGGEGAGNAFLLDSAVFVDDDRILFGRAAVERETARAHDKRMALRSFKTLLSVSDLDRALNTSAPVAIDPHRVFPMRDLIILYLAYLLAAVERARGADPELAAANSVAFRYAAPAWRSGDSAGMHGAIMRLFGEAEALRVALGGRLLSPAGVSLDEASAALPKALAGPRAFEMGLVYEATAAAAYTSIGIAESASHLIVLDMGAGTTDIAAVERTGARIQELDEARVTLKQAGDFIDRTIANIVLESSRWAKTQAQQSQLWRLLMAHMRDIKESLFQDGRARLRHEGRVLSVSLRDLERDRDFKAFRKDLAGAYAHSLDILGASARTRGGRKVQAVAVGGGAAAPFVQEIVKRRPAGGKFAVEARPATPDWAFTSEFRGNLAPVFPQLAIAIGGALAPESMLAAGDFSPGAGGRSDSRAARD
jgi:molecular chaperone DnaK